MIRYEQPAHPVVAGSLTLDDLEQLAFRYGGSVERDVANDRYILRGALIDGRRVDLGPVPGPVRVEVARG